MRKNNKRKRKDNTIVFTILEIIIIVIIMSFLAKYFTRQVAVRKTDVYMEVIYKGIAHDESPDIKENKNIECTDEIVKFVDKSGGYIYSTDNERLYKIAEVGDIFKAKRIVRFYGDSSVTYEYRFGEKSDDTTDY